MAPFLLKTIFKISRLFIFATKTYVVAAATLSHKEHMLKFRFITFNESDLPAHIYYAEWLIFVKTGDFLGISDILQYKEATSFA
ncbi:hypothetical protein B1B04_20980 [Lysinibacillus sp. KCTC 33748]|nr:hypothetical protein B1B04_20980 [Lysinibacillus sp. KCTC 33748]SKC11373.1 hypothetical protein SAMN06295926_12451 [Lysinibacillus sp. AC-3]